LIKGFLKIFNAKKSGEKKGKREERNSLAVMNKQ
jgi:hypothetical protein